MIQVIRGKSWLWWIVLCLVLVLLSGYFPGQIYAQESIETPKQVIIVRNEKGEPIKNAVFEIQNVKKEILETCISDEKGRAEIKKADEGIYQLVQMKTQEGYEVIKERRIEIKIKTPVSEEIVINKLSSVEPEKISEPEEDLSKVDEETDSEETDSEEKEQEKISEPKEDLSKTDNKVAPKESVIEPKEQELINNTQEKSAIDDSKTAEKVPETGISSSLETATTANDITVKISQVQGNLTQFTVSTVGYAGKTGIGQVLFPTWSQTNGQDDIRWYQGILGSNGEYSVTVDIKDHGFETGTYNIHAYIYGLRGDVVKIYANTYNQPVPKPAISLTEISNNSYKVRVSGVSSSQGVSGVVFPTWSQTNGQDDIRWESGSYIGNDTWEATINLKEYKQTYDTFISHAYVINKTGKMTFFKQVEKTIENPFNKVTVKIIKDPLNPTRFTINTVGYAGKTGIGQVLFPTWSQTNGQDDIRWYQGILGSNGEYSVTVDIKDHGFETGDYTIHSYIYGLQGNIEAFQGNTYAQKTPSPTIEIDQKVVNNSYKIRIKGASNPKGVSNVYFPTWSQTNGQDDIRWVKGTYIGNDTWEGTVSLNDYNRSYDKFISHVYVNDKNGKGKFIGATEKIIVNPFKAQSLKIGVKKGNDSSQFTISTLNCNGKPGITGVSFPVWTSRNGQDEIEWFKGKLGSNGEYSATVDNENHGFETGPYTIHAYLVGNKGENIAFTGSSYTMEKTIPTIEYDKAVLNNIFKVRIKNVSSENGVASMVFPTWSNSNGQDDIRWEQGTYIGNHTWEATINLRNYNIIVDDFITHAYFTDKNGKQMMAQNSVKSILQNTSTVYGDFDYPLNFDYQSNPNDPTDWFGPRWGSIHEGIDVPAPRYAKCYAVGNGVIEKAGYFMGYGRYVRIRTTDRYGESVSFFYGHLQQINVSVGQTVTKGQLVGSVGGSGYDANGNYSDYAYGEHLHFGAIANADWECVNPEIWIDFHNPYSNVR